MAEIITKFDLPSALQSVEMVEAMIDGANANASRVAPCLADTPTPDQTAEARLVLLGAVKRWAEAGSGALQSQSAGIFAQTVDTRQRTGFNLWPSEIQALQAICSTGNSGRAFEVDTMPADAGVYGVDYWWSSPTDRATF